ncbi:sorting nexin [Holotrichia oblita]|uniref:Sorting nexin n=1 Tax=Holotrichia oblita TaxID=644536 RepID=A0ACB9SJB3_HOLOL|nr:sorting nexin [Holotrichia oblita]
MLSNESIGKFLTISLFPIISILTAEYYYSILPFGGTWLVLYVLILLFVTVWLTWMSIQNVLKQSKPFTYDFEQNTYLKYSKKIYLFVLKLGVIDESVKLDKNKIIGVDDIVNEQRSIDDRIADFVKDVEQLFLMKWYPKISDDDLFLKETRNLLDDIMRRFLQIVVQVDTKKLVHGVLVIFLRHIKEFRKTVRRQQTTPKSIEELYRYTHIASKNEKAFEHFMCQITTKIFRQFLSWELYNSVPCKSLISILARKLTTYSLIYVSTPQTINYRIAQLCFSKENKAKLDFGRYDAVYLTDVDLIKLEDKLEDDPMTNVNSVPPNKEVTLQNGNTPSVTPKKIDSTKHVMADVNIKRDSISVKQITVNESSDKNQENYGRDEVDTSTNEEVTEVDSAGSYHAVSEPVKIHKSQSNKTWRNSSDLECISLGQDLLVSDEFNDPDLQIQDLIDKKPWKDNLDSLEVDEKHHPIWNITENIENVPEGREMNIPSPNIPSFISNTIKPIGNVTASTLHNMKELQQSTVNNVVKPVSQATTTAMHKIGDLQDEAAGVMEGIFDFGMAGIRKGLRLTGLQDNTTDKTKLDSSKPISYSQGQQKSQTKPAKLTKVPHIMSEEGKNIPPDETVWMNPLIKDFPNFDGQILLEKSPVSAPVVPTISTHEVTSPDPEYEDVTDLATTTAKLRSLLQQRTTESNINTPAVSPMPGDDFHKTFSTPLEYTGRYAIPSNSSDETEVDGTLPSLYKFCARTATGVFHNTLNTIKTALPGNISDQEGRHDGILDRNWDCENWTYVASDVGADDFSSRAQRLLNERRAYCTVDNAYEAVESLDVLNQVDGGWNTPITVYDDELDDVEVHIPFTRTLVDIFCELVAETNTFLTQESVVKMLLILFGELSEEYICDKSKKITRSINSFIGKLPNDAKKEDISMCLDEFTRFFLDIFPSENKSIF